MRAAAPGGFLVLPWPGGGGGSDPEMEPGPGEESRGGLLRCGALLGVALFCVAVLRRWIAGGVCRCAVRLDGKTVLITGANTGIGKETSRELACRGARVVMACRDLTRAEQAAEEIRRSTGNGNVVIRHLDLASLYSVRQFAKDFLESEDRLDILINNAGVMMCPRWLTEDGFETQLAVNHLGHFLLTNLLLPKLRSSTPSRVVTVSSIAHRGGRIDFDDLFFSRRPYSPLESYRQSKLANVLFSRELARRLKGSGVSSFCLHPGVIRTELGRHVQSWVPLLGILLSLPSLLLMKTPTQGSQTTVYCAVTPGLEGRSGRYFSDCAEKEAAPEGQDDMAARRLWEESARLVGLKETC
uniref:retinol dehydrogenase 13 n=1 Tax=Scatophagus argus TaxID=75038 RepID=UPI001ED7ED6F|nr:retinol dehydrogenase 13 [Scatophagus argus]XP_046254609.1 retinol dehydrogenase 13 [Scatophagus argus]XP_046254610.1 retinol dehydrogenase 13 [Scatophagus argus]XP_046254611.1 retinol dehydrogenase 13 [Scatophagus argus]XP_046254612.1 retinol dehydrogenase 13 [Scatophagus argus]